VLNGPDATILRHVLSVTTGTCDRPCKAESDVVSLAFVVLLAVLDIHRDTVAGERICSAAAVRTFYERRNFATAWDDANVAALRRAIAHAADDGLEPPAYHQAALASRLSFDDRDLLATDAFLLLATHLSQGAVDAEFARPSWCAPPRRIDVASLLQAALDNRNVEETLARIGPRHSGYLRLRAALARYREIERAGGWVAVPESRTSLRLGDRDPRVVALRQRLGVPGNDLFDAPLDAAVNNFQKHHGLAIDGVVGRETTRELNVPVAARIATLKMNLERWRWMPEDLGARYALVNIAGFTLDVVDNGRTSLSMKTVVGKQYTETPFFAAKITDVVINPWWNVPDSIAVKELWPKQRRDRQYLDREQMVVGKDGRIRQRPGAKNSLGRLKFQMKNNYDVYLHDTPAKSLFDSHVRAFSHGCIRLEKPVELALLLLGPKWDAFTLQSAVAKGKERSVALDAPVPVYVLYWTARVADDGDIEFYRDVYGRDSRASSLK